ncbi:MAG TPA: hypothetical protein VHM65_08810, partial [Candidatus Lustribacter sp.]|nr:hypothetical protein [Candidatus Lustribacter sp.]
STRITGELSQLAMTSAAVNVAVRQRPDREGLSVGGEPVRATRTGIDDVEIELRANSGDTPRSVAKAASGGELSRVMLAIEVVCSAGGADAAVPTMVFDEVDAGVGGRAALSVGARLAELARHTQVIVVTHLAQVAAFGDQHLVVRKGDDGSVTSSSVTRVAGDARLRELARMMSGDDHSEAGLVHAAELLGQAASIRDGPVPARTG